MTGAGAGADRLWRIAIWVHRGLVLLLAIHVLRILVTGGYRTRLLGHRISASHVEWPVIALMALLILGGLLRQRRFALPALARQGAFLVFALSLCVYLANGSRAVTGDTVPARYLPLSLVREGNLDLDEFTFLHSTPKPYYLERSRDHYVSTYPVAPALLALPVYLASALGGVAPESPFVVQLEKLAAAIITALSAAVLFLAVRRLAPPGWAWGITLVYAFGSSSLSTSSQALWQHGPSQLAIAATLYCLVRGRQAPRWVALAGFPLAASVACRPTDVLLAVPLFAYVLIRHPRALPGLAACGLPPVAFLLWYNAVYFGNPLRTQFTATDAELWGTGLGAGLAGLLLSPGRGLFVYSPVFALAVPGAILAWRRGGDGLLRALGVGAFLTVLVYSRWTMWWGGHSYGPRLLADLAPPLALLLVPLLPWLDRSWPRRLFVLLAAWSMLAHGAGVFWQDGRWDRRPDVDRSPQRLWSWRDNPLSNTVTDLSGRLSAGLGLAASSGTAPARVGASFDIAPAPPRDVAPGEGIEFEVRAINTGEAIWLSRAPRGEIALACRWVPENGAPPSEEEIALNHDVRPHRVYSLPLRLRAPQGTGGYLLEVGLLWRRSQDASRWITAVPDNPRRFAVRVLPVGGSAVAALLSYAPGRTRGDGEEAPRLSIAANGSRFEPGDSVNISLEAANAASGAPLDLIVGLLLPDRTTAMFVTPAGTVTAPASVRDHRRFVRLSAMPPGFVLQAPSLIRTTVPRDAMPGAYELFALATRPGALSREHLAPGDVVALEVAPFEILP